MILHSTKLRIKAASKFSKNIIKLAKNFGLYKHNKHSKGTWYDEVIGILKTLKSEYNFELKPTSKHKFSQSKDKELSNDHDSLDTFTPDELKDLLRELSQLIIDEVNTSYDNDSFIDKFNQELFCITDENLNYLNQLLNSFNSNEVNITIEQLYSIQKIAFSINMLVEKGITTKSYRSKVNSYHKLREKALDEFGVFLKKNPPFSNPNILYGNLDTKLSEIGLDKEQKRAFYSWFNIRERIPDQSITNLKLEEKQFEALVSDYHTLLSKEEQIAIITRDKNFTFNQSYYDLLKKYNLDEIPRSVLYYENKNMNEQEEIAIENEIESWQLDREKEILLNSIFLNHVFFEKELQQLLINSNFPLVIKAIEKYKLHRYIEIDENTFNFSKNISSS